MNIDLDVRLLTNVIKTSANCWVWQRARDSAGYGVIKMGRTLKGVHCVSYVLFVGEIPKGLCVCHYCNNKLCINPEHLYVGTREANTSQAHIDGLITPKRAGYHTLSLDETLQIGSAEGSVRDVAKKFGVATSTVSRSRAFVKREEVF